MTPPPFEFPEFPPDWVLPLPQAMVLGGVRSIRAIPYLSLPGFRGLELDAHLPEAASEPTPAVIFIHGGAWLMGTRAVFGPMYLGMRPDPFTTIAQLGIAVISIDYRMSGEALFPAQIHDVAAAHRYVVARAGELNIDPSRIAVWGESAGGHLAMLLAFQQGNAEYLGDLGAPVTTPPIAALVDWYGVADLSTVAGLPIPGPSPEAQLIGAEPAEDPSLAAHASPITHANASTPTLVVHGTGDAIVPVSQSQRLVETVRALGGDVEEYWVDDANHAWLGGPEHAQQAWDVTVAYLTRRLLA